MGAFVVLSTRTVFAYLVMHLFCLASVTWQLGLILATALGQILMVTYPLLGGHRLGPSSTPFNSVIALPQVLAAVPIGALCLDPAFVLVR